MEASQPLSTESFSYSWLVNLKPCLDGVDGSLRASLDACDEASFIEMDPRMPPSKRFFTHSQDFKFDFPVSQPPLTLVHADELFSNGYVTPLFLNPLKMEAYGASDSISAMPTATCETNPPSPTRCPRLSKRVFLKYLGFLYRRIRGRKSSRRAQSVDTTAKNKWVYSAETSPRISVADSVDEWRNSCDSESIIYEAVLHCKKSIGKLNHLTIFSFGTKGRC
ncbi:hypothetical protein V6N13_108629 [Hibiscus sabdariffa]|uniref:Membrane-associated kinase regulator 6 n=1 Tax=Hibiscus sabdariffa TaxID=183260 RepID=A0ABR2SSP7_9ROSI